MIKRLGLALIGLLFAVGATLGLAGSASAQAPAPPHFFDECNSSASINGIWSYDMDQIQFSNALDPGECRSDLPVEDFIYVPQVRVDVNNETIFGTGDDVDSYVPGHIDYGYDTCRENSENSDANPENAWANTGFRYKTYGDGNCNGNY